MAREGEDGPSNDARGPGHDVAHELVADLERHAEAGGSSGGGLFTDDGVCIGIVVRRNPMNDTMYSVPTYLIHESICSMFLPPDPMPIFVE